MWEVLVQVSLDVLVQARFGKLVVLVHVSLCLFRGSC